MRLKIFLAALCCAFCLAQVSLAQILPPPCPSNAFPPQDLCTDACVYCDFNGISSSTMGYTSQTPYGFCGSIENEQWVAFAAAATTATFTATPTGCADGNGVQIALYPSCDANPIACNSGGSGNGNNPVSVTTSTLVIGQSYFVMIDGFAGDQCSFTLSVSPPSAVKAPPVGAAGPIQGPSARCPGGDAVYQVAPVSGASAYTWNGPTGSMINGLTPPVTIAAVDGGNRVTVTLGSGGGQICVRGLNSCSNGPQVCKNIIVQPSTIAPTTLPPVTICFEDAPYTTPWGIQVFTSGLYQTTLQSWQGCDSLVRQQVTVKNPIIKNLPTQTICRGGSINIGNENIWQPGSFSVVLQSWQGCDSLVNGSLLVLAPLAKIVAPIRSITCAQPSVTLKSTASSGLKTWLGPQGTPVGMGDEIAVTEGGTYTLSVVKSAGGVSCSSTDKVFVKKNAQIPSLTASGGTLDAQHPTVQLMASSTSSPVNYLWTGPNGFSSTLRNPIVSTPGFYTVTVTNPQTGCASTKTVEVRQQ